MNNYETAEYLSKEETQHYDNIIQTSELAQKRKSHRKGKSKYLLQVGEINFDGMAYPVTDIGYTNFFYLADIDRICQRHLTQDNEFDFTNFEILLDQCVTNNMGRIEEKAVINTREVYLRGHKIDREDKTIDDMEVIFICPEESHDMRTGSKRDEWLTITETLLEKAGLVKLEYYNTWEIFIVDGALAFAYSLDDGGETIVSVEVVDLVEEGIVSHQKVKDKHGDRRRDRALSMAENMFYRISLFDESSYIDMNEMDKIATMTLWEGVLELKPENINMTHMAKEIGIHKNTLYRLQKQDMEKFNLYFRAYKCKLFENVVETELQTFI